MKRITLLLLVCTLALCGCRTKYVAVPEIHCRDSIVTQLRLDSVVLRDSVFQSVFIKGDTVFSVKYIYRDLYKYVLRVDTLKIEHRDTVYMQPPQQARTEGTDSTPAWYYRAALFFLLLLILSVIAFIVMRLGKYLKT